MFKKFLSTFFLFLLLSACSHQQNWLVRHPKAPQSPQKHEIGLVDLGDRWIAIRPSWFGQQLKLTSGQIHDSLGTQLQNTINSQLKSAFPQHKFLTEDIYELFAPTESFRLDSNIFAKLRLPAQGQKLDSVPQLMFIVHELTIGPDIDPSFFFDHTQGGEIIKRKVQSISAIALWTLWDNHSQTNLITGVSDTELLYDYSLPLKPQIDTLLHQLVQNMNRELAPSGSF